MKVVDDLARISPQLIWWEGKLAASSNALLRRVTLKVVISGQNMLTAVVKTLEYD